MPAAKWQSKKATHSYKNSQKETWLFLRAVMMMSTPRAMLWRMTGRWRRILKQRAVSLETRRMKAGCSRRSRAWMSLHRRTRNRQWAAIPAARTPFVSSRHFRARRTTFRTSFWRRDSVTCFSLIFRMLLASARIKPSNTSRMQTKTLCITIENRWHIL